MPRPLVLCLLSLIAACNIAAQPALDTYQSRFYRIHTNLDREEAAEYGKHMDLIFREYSQRFSILRGEERDKKDLYLLRTRQDYIATLRRFDVPAENSGGVYFYGPRGSGLATWIEDLSRDRVFNTLQHEGFHQFADSKLGRELPLWLNEGLAEYFGSAIIVDGEVRLGIVEADRIEKIRDAIKSDEALGFDELLTIQSAQWHANMAGSPKGSLQYDQSWSMVHFLVHGDGGRYRQAFEAYLSELSRGRTHADAFKKSFGTTDTAPFARRWVTFIKEVEPDPYSTALKRLEFLGSGLSWLSRHGAEAPADLDALKRALQEREFSVTYTSEAGQKTVSASDDALFSYESRRGESQPFELVAPSKGSDLPPSIRASMLRPGGDADVDPRRRRVVKADAGVSVMFPMPRRGAGSVTAAAG